jgi:NTP pyrophosphatase (non-canonical NTP hydrolase)
MAAKKPKTLKEYQKACLNFYSPYQTKKEEIYIWGLGVAGEAGDIAGCIKKTFAHQNNQTAGIRENLGDTMWYMAMICNFFGWDLMEILKENIEKLNNRYPHGFDKKRCQRTGARVDWNEKN